MDDYIQKHYETHFRQSDTRRDWKSVDSKGQPIPWITYAAIFQLEQYEFSEARVFEWGSGYSTLYWSKKCQNITSVEHDPDWFKFLQEEGYDETKVFPNLVPLEHYAEFILQTNTNYNLIVIDGYIHESMRYRCAEKAIERLSAGGMIVLDNSDWLPNTCDFLRKHGFYQADYVGFGPINRYVTCTSIFTKGSVSFPRKSGDSPGFIPGGLTNERD